MYCFYSTMYCKEDECPLWHSDSQQCKKVMLINRQLGSAFEESPKRTSTAPIRTDGLPSVTRPTWKIKGGEEASPMDPFAFAFIHGYDQATRKPTSEIREDAKELYDYIKEKGPFELDGFKYSISKGDVFLNRNKAD